MKNIKFVVLKGFEGFENLEAALPKPAKHYIPKWFKDMPQKMGEGLVPHTRTAKMCPSFIDIWNEGFVVPAPCDIHISYNKDTQDWEWATPMEEIWLDVHGNPQMLDWTNQDKYKCVFKLPIPFAAIVPKGYNFRQVPMMYHYNTDFEVAYGVYRADQVAEITVQVMYTSDKPEILIKQGEPLCYLIPYKREKFTMSIEPYNPKYDSKIKSGFFKVKSKFTHAYMKNTKD